MLLKLNPPSEAPSRRHDAPGCEAAPTPTPGESWPRVVVADSRNWKPLSTLETGSVLWLPNLAFNVREEERHLFLPSIARAKNISFDPASRRLGGAAVAREDAFRLRGLLKRFSSDACSLVDAVLVEYRGRIERARTSFRPVEIAGRVTSWRHDDTRLHVDSFPATPVHGRRILRLFTNVNPVGRPRVRRVGEPFAAMARRFAPQLRIPVVGSATLMRLLRITKSRRSAYDALMLQLHDAMKADAVYQREAPQETVEFPAGSTWMAFTDQVSHAAMSGQYQLEQTFLLPVDAMREPDRSPLRVLEQLTGRRLACSRRSLLP